MTANNPLLIQHFSAITYLNGTITPINTVGLFDVSYVDMGESPIDKFIEDTNKINLLYLGAPTVTREMGTIIFLGYMSAVESYMRAIIRRLINIDPYIESLVESRELTFGAALHHSKGLLPEALMEGTSFAGGAVIKAALKDFLGIKGNLDADVKRTLDEYSKICELRHCCVHRFGRLGTKNAISLGLANHKSLLEKPVALDRVALESISQFLRIFIKTINNYIFRKILENSVLNKDDSGGKLYSVDWTWNYSRDKKRFKLYYETCASVRDATASPSMRDTYEGFRLAQRRRNHP